MSKYYCDKRISKKFIRECKSGIADKRNRPLVSGSGHSFDVSRINPLMTDFNTCRNRNAYTRILQKSKYERFNGKVFDDSPKAIERAILSFQAEQKIRSLNGMRMRKSRKFIALNEESIERMKERLSQ